MTQFILFIFQLLAFGVIAWGIGLIRRDIEELSKRIK